MIWMRHKESGWFLTTTGPMKSLVLNGSRVMGYISVKTAKVALHNIMRIRGLSWNDFEAVSVNKDGEVVTL